VKKLLLIFILFQLVHLLSAQDKEFAREIVDTLTSSSMHGRGYVNNGDQIAADYISSQFEKFQLKTFGNNYFQKFDITMNTFPEPIEVAIDKEKLLPGKDFALFSSSPGTSGSFDLIWVLADSTGDLQLSSGDTNINFSNKVIVTDINQRIFSKYDYLDTKGVIFLVDKKVWWHVSDGSIVNEYFQMQVLKEKIPNDTKTINIQAQNKFYESYSTQNVVGFVQGKLEPDSFFVFTAHYDHLGQMGADVYFPGANDNASGTAMIIDLARYYSDPENQPDYSIVFMAFGAEEAGLLGSSYYANNPLFPLNNIKFLINLDMVGSGSEGIKIVNGTIFKEEFDRMVKINDEYNFVSSINERGEAANSDHFPFYEIGVPSIFIYTLGDECKEYHNIYDVSENVPLTEYEDLFRLLTIFIKTD
jgi:hypothetical protein